MKAINRGESFSHTTSSVGKGSYLDTTGLPELIMDIFPILQPTEIKHSLSACRNRLWCDNRGIALAGVDFAIILATTTTLTVARAVRDSMLRTRRPQFLASHVMALRASQLNQGHL
jgi:hypothetical protein